MRLKGIVQLVAIGVVIAVALTLTAVLLQWLPASASEEFDRIQAVYWFATVISIAIFSLVGALVIWLIKKDDSAYVGSQALEALNFQITIAIGWIVAMILSVILIGVLLFPVLFIVNLIFCILAAMAASRGENYRYPFAIRLIT